MKIRAKSRLLFLFCAAVLILAGCQEPQQKEAVPAAVVETDQQLLKTLQGRYDKAMPLKANGQCTLLYYIKGEPHKENFPVQLWVNPPSEIYMQGDVAFNAKGLVLGSNREQFWLALVPKEISSYWWGDWSQQSSLGTMMINPHLVLEGMGIVKIEDDQQWTFGQEDSFRVLTKQDGGKTKRIYVNCRTGLIRRIEYVGIESEATTITELGGYVAVADRVYVPTQIKIIRRLTNDKQGFVNVTLKISTVKPTSYTEEQRQFLFQRRLIQGFKHIYRIVGGKVVEQQQ